jgi:tetratricopeptide (TPR) repeat protein
MFALAGWRRASELHRRLALLSALFLASYALISNTALLIGVSVAERLMYWPSVFFALAAGLGAAEVHRRVLDTRRDSLARTAALTAGVGLLLALGVRSALRNADWRSDERLFELDRAASPQSVHLNTCLAQNYIWHAEHTDDMRERAARLSRAAELLDHALSLYSRYPATLELRGGVYAHQGDVATAITYFERALALNPMSHVAQDALATLRGQSQEQSERLARLREQVASAPNDLAPRIELGDALLALSDFDAALEQFQEAARLAPEDPDAVRRLGQALALNQMEDEAIAVFERLLALDSRDWSTHANLAKLLATRDPASALRHARRAFELNPDDLRAQLNLAEALALNGQRDEALRRLRSVLRSLTPQDPFYAAVRDRLAELEQGRP